MNIWGLAHYGELTFSWRLTALFHELELQGHHCKIASMLPTPHVWEDITLPQVLICRGIVDRPAYDVAVQYKEHGIRIIYDLDDNLWSCFDPPDKIHKADIVRFNESQQKTYMDFLDLADVITATMPVYKDLFKNKDKVYNKTWSDKLHILPSYMPSWVYKDFNEEEHFKKSYKSYFEYKKYLIIVNSGFEAKYNIPNNIELYDPYLKSGNTIVIGKEPEVFKVRGYKYEYVPRIKPLTDYWSYIKDLEVSALLRFIDSEVDINKYKSNIKQIEAGMIGCSLYTGTKDKVMHLGAYENSGLFIDSNMKDHILEYKEVLQVL